MVWVTLKECDGLNIQVREQGNKENKYAHNVLTKGRDLMVRTLNLDRVVRSIVIVSLELYS